MSVTPMNYDDALVYALSKKQLKELVERKGSVTIYWVHGLGSRSHLEELYVDKNTINNYEKSIMGTQFGYKKYSNYHEKIVEKSAFYSDAGMLFKKTNRHLVFFDKNIAEAYLLWQKTDPGEIHRDNVFMIRYNGMRGFL